MIGVYFFPLLGGWLSDRFFGKYNTMLWFSLIYCAGHACLAMFEDNRTGFYTGLFLIALGSGGIKPLVVSFVGDQFDQSNKHLAKIVFDAFYWTINFGSLLRLAADAALPAQLRAGGGVRHPRHPDVHRHAHLLARAASSTCTCRRRAARIRIRSCNVARTALTRAGAGQGRPGLAVAAIGAALAVAMLLCWAISRRAGRRTSAS